MKIKKTFQKPLGRKIIWNSKLCHCGKIIPKLQHVKTCLKIRWVTLPPQTLAGVRTHKFQIKLNCQRWLAKVLMSLLWLVAQLRPACYGLSKNAKTAKSASTGRSMSASSFIGTSILPNQPWSAKITLPRPNTAKTSLLLNVPARGYRIEFLN